MITIISDARSFCSESCLRSMCLKLAKQRPKNLPFSKTPKIGKAVLTKAAQVPRVPISACLTLPGDISLLHDQHMVCVSQQGRLVSTEDHGGSPQLAAHALTHHVLGHPRVQRGEDVVQQVHAQVLWQAESVCDCVCVWGGGEIRRRRWCVV